MNYKPLLIPFVLILSLVTVSLTHAQTNVYDDNQTEKVVLIDGTISRLMDGDPLYRTHIIERSLIRFDPDQALPYLLSNGWKIKSLHINEDIYSDYVYGYVIVEKIK